MEKKRVEIVPSRNSIDELTSADTVCAIDPSHRKLFERNKMVREIYEDSAKVNSMRRTTGLSSKGHFQHVGTVPAVVVRLLEHVYGYEYLINGGFSRWLQRHPEYRTGATKLLIQKSTTSG